MRNTIHLDSVDGLHVGSLSELVFHCPEMVAPCHSIGAIGGQSIVGIRAGR